MPLDAHRERGCKAILQQILPPQLSPPLLLLLLLLPPLLIITTILIIKAITIFTVGMFVAGARVKTP
jgi:hypothetical protein